MQQEYIATIKANDGTRRVDIVKNKNKNYELLQVSRRDINPPGNIQLPVGKYPNLETAQAEAKMIIDKYERGQV